MADPVKIGKLSEEESQIFMEALEHLRATLLDDDKISQRDCQVMIEVLESLKMKFLEEAMSFAKKKLSYKKDLKDVVRLGHVRLQQASVAGRLQDRLRDAASKLPTPRPPRG